MEKGNVKWFNAEKGYGFIEREGKEDVFVYYDEIQMNGFRKLVDGEAVEFEVEEAPKGLIARKVRRIN